MEKRGNVLSFAEFAKMRSAQGAVQQRYQCFMTTERLLGYCQVLIYDSRQRSGELFDLNFSRQGLRRQRHFYCERQVRGWLSEQRTEEISYSQALGLLGDAVRQNYKYQEGLEWLEQNPSYHLQQIWDHDVYNNETDLTWLLTGRKAAEIWQIYLRALKNRDAVLLYDLFAQQAKPREGRELYALQWSHVLEELTIFDAELIEQLEQTGTNKGYTFFLIVYGRNTVGQPLSVDLSLELIEERGGYYICRERILEARRFELPESVVML